ncbi:MAG: hypothetical protein QHJ82_10330 [Verrucomicrobiota bacterium]|nr:hypothetical protein [Verrucomicrobiota bacterium]
MTGGCELIGLGIVTAGAEERLVGCMDDVGTGVEGAEVLGLEVTLGEVAGAAIELWLNGLLTGGGGADLGAIGVEEGETVDRGTETRLSVWAGVVTGAGEDVPVLRGSVLVTGGLAVSADSPAGLRVMGVPSDRMTFGRWVVGGVAGAADPSLAWRGASAPGFAVGDESPGRELSTGVCFEVRTGCGVVVVVRSATGLAGETPAPLERTGWPFNVLGGERLSLKPAVVGREAAGDVRVTALVLMGRGWGGVASGAAFGL